MNTQKTTININNQKKSKIMSFLSFLFSGFSKKNQTEKNYLTDALQKPKIDESLANSIKKLENNFSKTLKNHTEKKSKITKHGQVKSHLCNKGSITSWEAIKLYGATRLSAIIFRLRNSGYVIESIPHSELDRNGNVSNFVTYKLHN